MSLRKSGFERCPVLQRTTTVLEVSSVSATSSFESKCYIGHVPLCPWSGARSGEHSQPVNQLQTRDTSFTLEPASIRRVQMLQP